DDYVMKGRKAVGHNYSWSLFDRSVSRDRAPHGRTTERRSASDVRRGDPGARPKTRAFVTERTWAYQTKSAFSDTPPLAASPALRNGEPRLGRLADLLRLGPLEPEAPHRQAAEQQHRQPRCGEQQ